MRYSSQPRALSNHLSASLGAILLLITALAGACRAEPVEVVTQAREALKSHDNDSFLATLTPRSIAIIKGGSQASKRSGKVFKLLRSGKPTKVLLPRGELSEPVIDGQLCTVLATKGKQQEQIILRLIRGRWRIDLLEMKTFYEQIKPLDE